MADKESLTNIEQDVQITERTKQARKVILPGFRVPCQRLHGIMLI